MSLKIEGSVIINCPPEAVFAVLTDVSHWGNWSKSAGKILDQSDNPAKLGTTWTQMSKLAGRELEAHVKVNVCEVNLRFGYQVNKPFPASTRWRLEPIAAGTQLTYVSEAELGGFFGIAEPLLRKIVTDLVSDDLNRLKTQIES